MSLSLFLSPHLSIYLSPSFSLYFSPFLSLPFSAHRNEFATRRVASTIGIGYRDAKAHVRSQDYRFIHAAGWRPQHCFILHGQKRLARLVAVGSLCPDVSTSTSRDGAMRGARLKAKVSRMSLKRESVSLMTDTM